MTVLRPSDAVSICRTILWDAGLFVIVSLFSPPHNPISLVPPSPQLTANRLLVCNLMLPPRSFYPTPLPVSSPAVSRPQTLGHHSNPTGILQDNRLPTLQDCRIAQEIWQCGTHRSRRVSVYTRGCLDRCVLELSRAGWATATALQRRCESSTSEAWPVYGHDFHDG